LYEKRHPNMKLIYNFGGSGMLLLQIEQGAPVDVFISAAPAQMDTLEKKGLLLAGTRVNLAENRMVLIVPSNSTNVTGFADLAQPNVRVIALGEPVSVPAGHYAQQVLEHLHIYQQVRPKVVLAKDVRQVLAYVETGDADAGIVYATDARITSRVRVVAEAPADSHDPVIYPGAVIRRGANPAEAREFLSFLAGAEARAVLVKYGFTVPPTGSH
jgi:molybdate transport system substrate-binding protein